VGNELYNRSLGWSAWQDRLPRGTGWPRAMGMEVLALLTVFISTETRPAAQVAAAGESSLFREAD